MMTSADEPGQSVGKLKYRTVQRPDVLKGHYRFKDDIVILMMKKSTEKLSYNQREYHVMEHGSGAATFCIQLEMSHTKKRNIPQLLWRQYSVNDDFCQINLWVCDSSMIFNALQMTQCRITEEVKSDFDLTPNKYPPLMFSRVKSYESTSDVALWRKQVCNILSGISPHKHKYFHRISYFLIRRNCIFDMLLFQLSIS